MTELSLALQQTLAGLAGPERAAALAERLEDETGAQTAEYGILTLAAVGFAGLLAVVLTSGDVQSLLMDIVQKALTRD
ncbi:DUF4244 domain-containing protein [Micrococcus sp.]|uniref:DUF4244 domain-containing protein n=1 Tax=Micrococcus sp. TaxID=1271 RepID=UPI002A90AF08|nr:DUF4244 domain-containing protein [Micrococcus sp.]MDY6055298.1 DUF4244 domain-containing protein [Micrococcus sp.]